MRSTGWCVCAKALINVTPSVLPDMNFSWVICDLQTVESFSDWAEGLHVIIIMSLMSIKQNHMIVRLLGCMCLCYSCLLSIRHKRVVYMKISNTDSTSSVSTWAVFLDKFWFIYVCMYVYQGCIYLFKTIAKILYCKTL